jgi:hypothetical protein
MFWNSHVVHVRVGQLFSAKHVLKISVQIALKTGDQTVMLGSCYPSKFAVLSGPWTVRIGGH